VVKVLAFANEFDDPAAVGDEFGLVIPLAVMVIVSGIILIRARKETAPLELEPATERAQPGQRDRVG
jgi:hypothetical protein